MRTHTDFYRPAKRRQVIQMIKTFTISALCLMSIGMLLATGAHLALIA